MIKEAWGHPFAVQGGEGQGREEGGARSRRRGGGGCHRHCEGTGGRPHERPRERTSDGWLRRGSGSGPGRGPPPGGRRAWSRRTPWRSASAGAIGPPPSVALVDQLIRARQRQPNQTEARCCVASMITAMMARWSRENHITVMMR